MKRISHTPFLMIGLLCVACGKTTPKSSTDGDVMVVPPGPRAVAGQAGSPRATAGMVALPAAGAAAESGAPAAGSRAANPVSGGMTAAEASASADDAGVEPDAGAVPTDPSSELVENTGTDCAASAAALKPNPKLPDPFSRHDGSRITKKSDWRCRRSEIKQDLERYEIGPKPDPAMVEASLSGGQLNVKITTSAGSIVLSSSVTASAGSDCVAIGMNIPSKLITGCVQVPFMHDQVVKYANNGTRSRSDPFYTVYPELWDRVGNYAAWSWGISRLIDGIVQLQSELKIDPKRIGVQGCSYAGKMALFAGALDERVALTIAQESGGGGINAWRTSQDFTARTGTDIEKIDNTNYAWFLGSMKQLDPYSLPHDHHELNAMIAPRALLALGNQDYDWLGDESGWKSINAAKEVWRALDAVDHVGFDFTSNHTHCAAAASQVASADAFVDRFLKGKDVDTAIAIAPQEGNFELDFGKSIDWQTPVLP